MKTIGVDIGYYATKAVCGKKVVTFPSVAGTPNVSQLVHGVGDGETIINLGIGDSYKYIVGRDAILKSRSTERREEREWITSHLWKVLFYHAISQLEPEGGEFRIVTGLPVDYFSSDHVMLKKIVEGLHKFAVNDKRLELRLSSIVTMQPFGAVCNEILSFDGNLKNKSLSQSSIGVIDIGGKTTNILTVDQMADIGAQSFSTDTGGWDIVRAVKTSIQEKFFDYELKDHEVAEIVASKTMKRFGKDVDVSDLVEPVTDSITREIVALTTQVWGNASGLDKIFISGGGANLIGETIADEFPHAVVVSDPEVANAKGYYKYGKFIEKI